MSLNVTHNVSHLVNYLISNKNFYFSNLCILGEIAKVDESEKRYA